MASEVTLTGVLAYSDSNGVKEELSMLGLQQTVTTKVVSRGVQSIAITETVLNLAGLGTLGYVMFKNLDATNYVDVKTAASGVIFARLRPGGGFCILELGSGVTAPVAIAHTAACLVDKLLCSQ